MSEILLLELNDFNKKLIQFYHNYLRLKIKIYVFGFFSSYHNPYIIENKISLLRI